jgi:hypothetical protein
VPTLTGPGAATLLASALIAVTARSIVFDVVTGGP